MDEHRLNENPGKFTYGVNASAHTETSLPGALPPTSLPSVLVVGPGPAQVGGVTTFIQILMSSHLVAEKYDLIHLDTSRAQQDLSSAGRFSLRNLYYLLGQACRIVLLAVRKHPVIMHLAVTSGWSFWKGSLFLLMGKVFRMRIVAHIHGGSMRNYYQEQHLPVRRLIGWMLRQADVVLALSGQWQQFLLKEIRPDLRVIVLPNSVDTQFAVATELDDYTFRQNGNVVLFVGQLTRGKGVFDIIRAVPLVLATHQDTVFLFAGSAHEPQIFEEMERITSEANLSAAVQFLGEITGPAKLDLFRRATLFILPSYSEGLPYVLLEAMAIGLPVITTSVGAIPEIVQDGEHGFLIEPGDNAALANRILRLLEDEPLRRRMGFMNRQLIRDHYMPDRAMNQLVAIYDQLQGIDNHEVLPSSQVGEKEQI